MSYALAFLGNQCIDDPGANSCPNIFHPASAFQAGTEQHGSKGPTPQGWGPDVCTSLVCWLFWQGSFYCPSTSLGASQASEFRILTKPDVPISLPIHGVLQRRCILAFPKLCIFSSKLTLSTAPTTPTKQLTELALHLKCFQDPMSFIKICKSF